MPQLNQQPDHQQQDRVLIAETFWCHTHGVLWRPDSGPKHYCQVGTFLMKSLFGREKWTKTNLDDMDDLPDEAAGRCNAIEVSVVSR